VLRPQPVANRAVTGWLSWFIDSQRVRRYLTFMTTTISTKGQIVLPAEIRQQDGIEPGQEFDIERIERGVYRLVRRQPRPNEGLVDWLLACPEKGFFVPIESESTDTL
jgi:AbrB family looped-hinge helix DNA binding protein